MTQWTAKYTVTESVKTLLEEIYHRLFDKYRPQHWWPGETPFEVMIGAVLTQSAAWKNVETAISNLKISGLMSPATLREKSPEEVAPLIRSAVYYNVKARKLKALVEYIGNACDDNLDRLFEKDTGQLRDELLAVWGIGEETADSILLYAANKPVFVIDAYTRRIMSRIGIQPENDTYSGWQDMFMNNLPADAVLFNEYHALLVRLGKETCRPKPLCPGCPLSDICLSAVGQS
ncbi:MAG: endonuclease [Dehalococcoidales bacterium]|nr:endonuclease [Dehalococcoidales bacterium]